MARALFQLGQVVATPGALGLGVDLVAYVRRHVSGDFGTCGRYELIELTAEEARRGALATSDDGKLNVYAIRNGGRVLSAYDTAGGRLWVMTDGLLEGGNGDADTVTTCLLPADY